METFHRSFDKKFEKSSTKLFYIFPPYHFISNSLAHLKVSNGLLSLSSFFACSPLPSSFPRTETDISPTQINPQLNEVFHQQKKNKAISKRIKVIFSLLFCGGNENENANLMRTGSRKMALLKLFGKVFYAGRECCWTMWHLRGLLEVFSVFLLSQLFLCHLLNSFLRLLFWVLLDQKRSDMVN